MPEDVGEKTGMSAENDPLVDVIYSGALDSAAWKRFLDVLVNVIPASRAALIVHDELENLSYILQTSSNWSVGNAVARSRHNAAEAPPSATYAIVGPPTHDVAAWNRLPFSQYGRRSISVGIDAPAGAAADMAVTQRLNRLVPHLKRAFAHYQRLSCPFAADNPASTLLDSADIGVIVVRSDARIAWTSRPMRDMLKAAPLITVSQDGQVCFRNENTHAVLIAMLRRRSPGPDTVTLPEPGVKMRFIRLKKDPLLEAFEGPTVVVLVELARARQPAADLGPFASKHRLTKAEQRALAGILAGKPIDVIAEEAFVSRETVRSQIKSLYAKTGAKSRADVIRVALLPHGQAAGSPRQ